MDDINTKKTCCAPNRDSPSSVEEPTIRPSLQGSQSGYDSAVRIAGGVAMVGTRSPGIEDDGETPLRTVRVKPFRMAPTVVTNEQFSAFVEATGYVTEAERFGWSFVFWSQVDDRAGETERSVEVEWWRKVDGADWRNINGPGTGADSWKADHPVVHVSWHDARAYCAWVGGRLPSEAEWEHAARAGAGDVPYPWGETAPNDHYYHPCNIWQGAFPHQNTGRDGYITTAPAQSFEPNGFGLYNMVGNVWEWTSDAYAIKSLKKNVRARLAAMKGYKTLKGGSFLCHASYCNRYRIAARIGNSPDSGATHQGFRVLWPERGQA